MTAVHYLAYQRRSDGDWLVISASFSGNFGFEGLYHHSYVLWKSFDSPSWENGKVYHWSGYNVAVPPELQYRWGPFIPIKPETMLAMPVSLMRPLLSEFTR
jgi:hypothetical protein